MASQLPVTTVKVAAIQSPSVMGDVEANTKSFTKQIKLAAKEGAKFIVLPEAAITGYASQDFRHSWCTKEKSKSLRSTFIPHDPCDTAQFKDGPMVQYFMSLCKQLKIYLTVPYVEKARNPHYIAASNNSTTDSKQDELEAPLANKPITEDEDIEFLYYNSITLINPDGAVCAHYRKINLWPAYDNSWATPGEQIVTVDTEYGRIGLGICFDVHKILPLYKEQNIWCLLYCIAWVSQTGLFPQDEATFRWFNMTLPERLKTQEIPYYIVGANWSIEEKAKQNKFLLNGTMNDANKQKGSKLKWTGYGSSTIYAPRGNILQQSSFQHRFGDDIIYAEIPCMKVKV